MGRRPEGSGSFGIVQIGMAFGVQPVAQGLGDVLVSTSLIPYGNRVVRDHADGGGRYLVDHREAGREAARASLVELFLRERHRDVDRDYRVHFGALLSGAARIHSASYRDELIRGAAAGVDPIVGGEMEGVGLLAASAGPDDPSWCIVKGISDFADSDRDHVIGEARAKACRNAADFVLSALQNDR